MPRSTGWTFLWALLLGIAISSLFLLYSPYLNSVIGRQLEEILKKKEFTLKTVQGTGAALQGAPKSAVGTRFQLISEGGQTFLADLQEGRVWRYFHHTREGGWAREAEGFIPLRFYYGGKKYYTAREVKAPKESNRTSESDPDSGRRVN